MNITIMDGAMGTELKPYISAENYTTLWSASAFLTPEGQNRILETHKKYIQAGATLITTNTYACTQDMLSKGNKGHKQEEWIRVACKLARDAVGESSVYVAGSLPPLKGSYRPDLVEKNEFILKEYCTMVQAMDNVDIILCETMSTISEAVAAVSIARKYSSKPVWVSFTLDSETLRSGESIVSFVEAVKADAYLINCCKPEIATLGLSILRQKTSKMCGVYANRFKSIPLDWTLDGSGLLERRVDLSPSQYADYVEQWIEMGATIVGGCCGITPEYIENIKNRLH